MMKNGLTIAPYVLLTWAIILNAGAALASTGKDVPIVSDESKAGAPLPPTPVKDDRVWNLSKGLGWEKRFFDKPFSPYIFPKSQFPLPNGSGIPLKSPGMFPGIEFGVEMHSFQALQSLVPPESLSKPFNFRQDQPLLLSPSNFSPDYNGGFLRLIW